MIISYLFPRRVPNSLIPPSPPLPTQNKNAVGLDPTNTADEHPADANAMLSCLASNALNLNTKCPVCMATFWLHSVSPDKSLQKTGCRICGPPWLFLLSGLQKVHDARLTIQRSNQMSEMEETKVTPMNQTNESPKTSSACGSSDCS